MCSGVTNTGFDAECTGADADGVPVWHATCFAVMSTVAEFEPLLVAAVAVIDVSVILPYVSM